MEHLRAQNYDLQVRINEYENEINKKGIECECLASALEVNYFIRFIFEINDQA
jgi:hypothetical protein